MKKKLKIISLFLLYNFICLPVLSQEKQGLFLTISDIDKAKKHYDQGKEYYKNR